MKIKQWEDKNLAQFSYGILSDCEKKIILIDPSRNPKPYLDFASEHNASIIGIIETHPHADFISSHLELHGLTGAVIYTHSLAGATYPHEAFDDGATIEYGKIRLTSLHTPGHSPDSICVLLEHDGVQKAVFAGDTLFIGDCGRPDLREGAGNIQSKKEDLARLMYHSLRNKLMQLNDEVLVYPAHGAGTLCGKNLSKENSSTIKKEKQTNWSLQDASEDEFVSNLLKDQPFVPAYFPFDVELNRDGAQDFEAGLSGVKIESADISEKPENHVWVVDARDENAYKMGHLPHSMNLMENGKFETYLGSIIKPGESFYLAGGSEQQLKRLMERVAAIGYEPQIKAAYVIQEGPVKEDILDLREFKEHQDRFTIVDVRNASEVKEGKPFKESIAIPLADLRNRVGELPSSKPIVVHCAGGYRSAAGSSIIKSTLEGKVRVYDLGEAIKEFS